MEGRGVSRETGGLEDLLENWMGDSISDLYRQPPEKADGILMGAPIWGAKYIDRFGHMCLPTLLSEKNLEALRDKCRLVLFTDKGSFGHLWQLLRQKVPTGFDIRIHIIPDGIMEYISRPPPNNSKYWALGVAHNVALQMAGRSGMSWHMLLVDHLYAHEYFPNLLRLGKTHEAIAQTGISANVDALWPYLEDFRQDDGALTIPDRDLGNLGWKHLHKQTQASLITKDSIPNNLPGGHFWAWQGRDRLYLSCCHMNAAYMSPRLCALAPTRIPATMDTELPRFMPNGAYVPKAEDGLTFIEASDDSKGHDKHRSFDEFIYSCLEKVRYQDDWDAFVDQLGEVPIHEQATYVDEATVREQHAWLKAQLRDEKPTPKAAAAYRLIGSLAYKVG